jgi:hypothetical protein
MRSWQSSAAVIVEILTESDRRCTGMAVNGRAAKFWPCEVQSAAVAEVWRAGIVSLDDLDFESGQTPA